MVKKQKTNEEFDADTETVIQMTNKNKLKIDEEKRKQRNKEAERRKRKHKKIKKILKAILFIGVVGGIIAFALTSPIFNIKNIRVVNNSNVPTSTIISLSGLKTGENLFAFIDLNVEKNIKENNYIEDVKIHRKLPDTIELEVKEREPQYSAQILESYAYISQQGYILEISKESKDLLILKGLKTPEEDLKEGNRLNLDDLERLEDVIKIMSIAKKYEINEKVTSIDISSQNDYIIYLEEEKKTIHIGDNTNMSDKMLNAVTIMEMEKEHEGDVFVNGELNNGFQPYFREKV